MSEKILRGRSTTLLLLITSVLSPWAIGCDCGSRARGGGCNEGARMCDSNVLLECSLGWWEVAEDCSATGRVCREGAEGATCALDVSGDAEIAGGDGDIGAEVDADSILDADATEELEEEVNRVGNISCGGAHTCVIDKLGSLWCWGDGSNGQLGYGGEENQIEPVRIGAEIDSWEIVSAGDKHTCGLKSDDSLWCWGGGSSGQLGYGGEENQLKPIRVSGAADWSFVSAGRDHTCGLKVDGSLWCWGAGGDGQLGYGGRGNKSEPVRVGDATDWIFVSAGKSHTCGVKADGSLWCWGDNGQDELGPKIYVPYSLEPIKLPMERSWKIVVAGSDHTCALDQDSTVWCWGGEDRKEREIHEINQDEDWLQLSSGTASSHSTFCGLKTDGSLWCWGSNQMGELGCGDSADRSYPVVVAGGRQWLQVDVGGNHACGIDVSGRAWCWGSNRSGQAGVGFDASDSLRPAIVGSGNDWKLVTTGKHHTCALKEDSTLWCWGSNESGQLGLGVHNGTSVPEKVGGMYTWFSVNAGKYHTCAISTDGTLLCWGSNSRCQTGVPNNNQTMYPTEIPHGTTWLAVTGGNDFSCAIDANRDLYCWGNNDVFQLGEALPSIRCRPVRVTGQYWLASDSGNKHSCGLTSKRRLYCWGLNQHGQIGDGTCDNRSTPTPVLGDDIWIAYSAGDQYTCGVKADGTLWCWGKYEKQEDGWVTGCNSEPMQLVDGDDWRYVALGKYDYFSFPTVCAIKADSSLWCWGTNDHGQIGDGTMEDSTEPKKIGSGWAKVAIGVCHTCGIKKDGTLWCWGCAEDGQLGNGGVGATVPMPVRFPLD